MKLSEVPDDTVDTTPKRMRLSDIKEDDAKVSPLVASSNPKGEHTAMGTFARNAIENIAPTAAGWASFAPGFAAGAAVGSAIKPGIGTVAGGLVGGLTTSMGVREAVTWGQNKLVSMLPESVKEAVGLSEEQKKAADEAHPYAAMLGGTLPQAALLRPSLDATKLERGVGAALAAGGEGVSQFRKGEFDPGKLAIAAGTGAALSKQTKLGSTIGGLATIPGAAKAPMQRPKAGLGEQQSQLVLDDKTYQEEIMAAHHKIVTGQQANDLALLNSIKEGKIAPKAYQSMKEDMFHAAEDPKIKLSPEAQQIKAKVLDPLKAKNDAAIKTLENYGVYVSDDLRAGRMPVQAEKPGFFERMKQGSFLNPTETQKLKTTVANPGEATAFAIQDPQGWRAIAQYDPKAEKVSIMRGGNVVGTDNIAWKDFQSGNFKFMGREVQRKAATAKEIEANTAFRYTHDPIAGAADANVKLEGAVANLNFLEAMENSPSMKNLMAKGKDVMTAPKEWRTVDSLPGRWRDYKWEPHVAEAFEDIAGGKQSAPLEAINSMTHFLAGSLFWNPNPHLMNVLNHSIVEKGLVGGATDMVKGTARLLVHPSDNSIYKAIKSVITKDDDYLRYLREGAGMVYPSVITKDMTGQIMKKLGDAPEASSIAKAFGYANPVNWVKGVYNAAQHALWAGNDVIMMQAYFEHESSGMTAAEAIKAAERHVPNYQIPPRVGADNQLGRALSQTLRSPYLLNFGRYEYGRLHSYGEMIKDVVSSESDLATRAHALDQMAMLGVMTFMVYPMVLDHVARAVTGNKNAQMTRAGASSIPYWMGQVLEGNKDVAGLFQSMFVPSSGTKALFELASNRDSFTGQKLFESTDDIMKGSAHFVPPLDDMYKTYSGKRTPEQMAWKAMTIDSKSDKQIEAAKAFKAKESKRIENKRKKKKGGDIYGDSF